MNVGPLSFRVLGAVRVEVDAQPVKIAAPRQRALLTLLLLNSNRTVNSSTLIDNIWGDVPPQHPDTALHIVVCRLRRALGPVASRLVRDSAGYRIEVGPDELDLTRAHAHASAAHRSEEAGDIRRGASEFDAALGCRTGEPIADVTNFPFYDVAARRLRELQLGIVESRNAAYLRCGRHLEVLPDIESWIEANPWRERLRAHHMVALYRSGRQIEALAVYDDLRRLLLTDFGVDPCDDIQKLQVRILSGDATLLGRRSRERTDDVVTIDDEDLGMGRDSGRAWQLTVL